jgi:hypothetical protein
VINADAEKGFVKVKGLGNFIVSKALKPFF